MAGFELSKEHSMIKEAIRNYCEKEIKPYAATLDQSQEFQKDIFMRIFKGLGDLGFLGLLVPEEYGGFGSDFISAAIVLEEISKVSAGISLAYIAQTPVMAYSNIYVNGTDASRKKYLAPLCRGEIIGANALTEPDAGSDLYAIKTTAVRESKRYVLNGSKTFITNAPIADIFYVLAKDEDTGNAMSGFLVDRDTDGLAVGKPIEKCGFRSSCLSEVFFDNCLVPEENLVGERGRAMQVSLDEIELQRILGAFVATGIAQAAFQEALNYSKVRVQFGKPISEFQMIKSLLSDMATNIEVAKAMNEKSVIHLQMNHNNGKRKPSSLGLFAKKFAATSCVKVVSDAVQIHGAYGYTKEFPVERYFRESKFMEIGAGSTQIMELQIAKHLLRS